MDVPHLHTILTRPLNVGFQVQGFSSRGAKHFSPSGQSSSDWQNVPHFELASAQVDPQREVGLLYEGHSAKFFCSEQLSKKPSGMVTPISSAIALR